MTTQLIIFDNPQDTQAHSIGVRQRGQRVGLVPTMGALHQGHLSLLDYARQQCDCLVVSIFVNPLQFDRPDDLAKYPRTWEQDLAHCAAHGADVIFAPTPASMYPQGFQTKVSLGPITQGLCGAFRPGHFDGVATVVLKLFTAVKPNIAAFGEKDYQQLMIIKRMVTDLNLDVEVVGRPTVREADGLAMSSRNVRLNPQERQEALCLWRALGKARALAQDGQQEAAALAAVARAEIEGTPSARLEYLEIVDSTTLEPLVRLDRPARMCLAAWVGGTRLIDNVALN